MNTLTADLLTVAELQRLLTQTDPAILLTPPRILRRVIKRDRGMTGLGLQVPHRKSYLIDRERLLTLADPAELGLESGRETPSRLILLPLPDRQRLAKDGRAATLLRYWRLLFHIRIHSALRERIGDDFRSRIERIGRTEWDEATAVLRQERFLLPPGDAATIYEEFAAVYLELRYFEPHLLPLYFPACLRFETIDAVLAEDVDAEALFAATRLEGVATPAAIVPGEPAALAAGCAEPNPAANTTRSPDTPRAYLRLLRRAEMAGVRGNMVRAAIFRMRAVSLAPSGQAGPTRAAAHREMERFRCRLQNALGYTDEVADDWRQALFALMEPASRGIWPSESRMLYDLQKACIDRERPVYAVDLVEWFVTLGRRPILRLLPFHDSVRLVKHLRSALHRSTVIRIAEPIRRRLLDLLLESTHRAEHRLRENLRPVVRAALDKVGLQPSNIAEEVARDKIVVELIDRVVEHGFFAMSDLRDALARNRLKLPDLPEEDEETRRRGDEEKRAVQPNPLSLLRRVGRGIKTFFLGDRLLRANRQLAVDLDGVYHRGEIYLRWLQRFSAVAFGTYLGRLLTLYVALPFGCSLALIKMWDHVSELIQGAPPEGSEEAIEAAKHINPYSFALLGAFFLALFHVAPFRRGLLWAVLKTWRGLRWLLNDLPTWLLHRPWLVRILQSRAWLFCYQFVVKPLPWSLLCFFALSYFGLGLSVSIGVGAGVFTGGGLLFNSRLGVYLEEVATDSLMRTWQLVHADLVPGLVRWIIYLYRRLQEEMERLIYTVDEWLRFRPGDSRLSLVAKPVLGLFWFVVTYIFRVLFNLFIEPTFNPIKHFPAVTVTAKMIVPIYGQLLATFRAPIEPVLGKALGNTAAVTAIGLLPGLAGFLVWELKENWRLYRVNQSPTLRPEIVGHHGETVLRLMRPGLHSGTLPKLYARLRHGRSPRKQYETLHHLREGLRRFVERNLFATLAGSKSWNNAVPLHVGDIPIATNRIRIELKGPTASIHIDFEEHGGWLLAGLTYPNLCGETWLSRLTPERASAFRDALGGFYKQAGVDAVREQIASLLPAGTAYDLMEKGLVVWPQTEEGAEVVYDLEGGPEIAPRSSAPTTLPQLTADAVLYSATPIRWVDWVQTWQLDRDGKGHAPLVPLQLRLLPKGEQSAQPNPI